MNRRLILAAATLLAAAPVYAVTYTFEPEHTHGLFLPQVSDEVQVHITAEAAEKSAYEQYLKAQAAREAAKKAKQ